MSLSKVLCVSKLWSYRFRFGAFYLLQVDSELVLYMRAIQQLMHPSEAVISAEEVDLFFCEFAFNVFKKLLCKFLLLPFCFISNSIKII